MKRWARIAGAVALASAGIVALLVGAALATLRTDWGGNVVRGIAVRRLNGAIAGQVEIDGFSFGGDHLSLRNVVLREPAGDLVARVPEIEIAFSPLALLGGQVRLRRVDITAPALFLRQDGTGLNLARALASRDPRADSTPAKAKAETQSGGLTLDLALLRVSHGRVEFRAPAASAGGAPPRVAKASDISLEAEMHYQTATAAFATTARVTAALEAPLRAPFTLRLTGHGRGERRDLGVNVTVGETAMDASLRQEEGARGTFRLSQAHVTPELVRALMPGVPLRVPLDLTAQVERDGPTVKFSASLHGAAGVFAAQGEGDMAVMRARELTLTARHIDLGALIDGLPGSDLTATVTADGGGRELRTLTGGLSLHIPVGLLDGAAVGPISLRVRATQGHYELLELGLHLPGLAVSGHGETLADRLVLHLGIAATNLARTSRLLASFRALRVPSVSGRGQLELSISGTPAAPGFRAAMLFPRLAVAGDSAVQLSLMAQIPNVHAPEIGRAALHVARAHVAGREWREVDIQARSTAAGVAVDARAGGPTPLVIGLAGLWGPHQQWIDLQALSLRYPEAAWRLEAPARLTLRSDHLAVAHLELRAGEQRIRADLDKRGDRIRAQLALAEIDLGALPRQVLPAGVAPGGRLDLDARIGGTLSRPTGQATVDLRDGRFGRYRDLALRLEGRYAGRRISGNIAAAGLGTALRARFELPTEWPPRQSHAPLSLDVTVDEVDLSALRGALGVQSGPRVSGKASVSLRVAGNDDAPAIHLVTAARNLVLDDQRIGDVSVRVGGDARTPLTAELTIHASGASDDHQGHSPPRGGQAGPLLCAGAFNLRTDLDLAAMTRRLPTLAELMRAHFNAAGDLRDIPLAALARLAGAPMVLSGGTASLRVSAQGTRLAPTGALNVQVAGATGPRFPATDGRLDVAFGQKDTRVALRVLRGDLALLSASGILALPARSLGDRAALVTTPLTFTATLGPLRFRHGELPGMADLGVPEALSGSLGATLFVDGTLARPALKLIANLSDVRLGAQPLGGARAQLTYASRRADVDVRARANTGGELRLTGHGSVDLGYSQLTRGLGVRDMPIEGQLTAQRFDLAWLSGLSPEVRAVGGQLSATIGARGRVGKPAIEGQLEWTNGTLKLAGLGSYRDVHLKAHGNERSYWLDELSLASGAGNARVKASASRTGKGDYDLVSAVSLRRFPIYGQGQALAVLSIDSNLTGSASSAGLNGSLKISESHVELTDAKQKKLQPLEVPSDVIFMAAGKPADPAQAAKHRALAAELRMGGPGAVPVDDSPHPTAAPEAPPFQTHLAIHAPRNLWVRGKDASLELGLEPDFRVEAAPDVKVYGQVIVRRGRIDVLGRRFDVRAGSTANFIGSPDAPRLDVRATYLNESENITVNLTAKGALDHLSIAVVSPDRPDLTEGQLYTLIVTGRLQLGGNSAGSASASNEAASLVGGLVASQLQKTLAKTLPLDVLTLQAGEGLSGSRLEAGTYLTSKLYAGYVGRVGANPALLQNRNAVHLEYQLSRRWSFDGEYGDVGTGTADVVWTKNY